MAEGGLPGNSKKESRFEEILKTEYSGISDAADYCDVEKKVLGVREYSEQCYSYLTELLPLVLDNQHISGRFSSSETAYFEMLLALRGRYGAVDEYCKRLKRAFRRNSTSREFSYLYYSDTENARCKRYWGDYLPDLSSSKAYILIQYNVRVVHFLCLAKENEPKERPPRLRSFPI